MAGKLTDDKVMSASRLPGLMGFSKYNSPNDELQYSINAIDGKERPDISNERMEWGNTLEPVVLKEACKRLGIKGDRVLVWSDQVREPVAVRYAWANVPEGNLINRADLPASPFRTDVPPVGESAASAK